MVWFKVDDNLSMHPKVLDAGNAALGLWVRAGSWSANALTNGFIPRAIARQFGTKTNADRLVNARLWTEVEGGYQFHEWNERQPSKDEVESKREQTRQKVAEHRKRKKRNPVTHQERNPVTPDTSNPVTPTASNPVTGDECNPVSNQVPARAVSRPDPTRPPIGGSRGEGTSVTRDPATPTTPQPENPPPRRCPLHRDHPNPPPCRSCATHREHRETWNREHQHAAAERRRAEHAQHAATTRAAIDACPLCDEHGYRPGATAVCNHDPERDHRAQRGIQAIRAALQQRAGNENRDGPYDPLIATETNEHATNG